MLFHIAVPLTSTGFNIARDSFTTVNYTVTLEWDPPDGLGPEATVDYYWISVTPRPLSHPISNLVLLPPWNVTLDYNVVYTVSITVVNCAGDSNAAELPADIEYGKSLYTK